MEDKKNSVPKNLKVEILGTYSILALIGLLTIQLSQKNPWEKFLTLSSPLSQTDLGLTIFLSVGILTLLSYLFELSAPSYKKQKRLNHVMIGSIPLTWAIFLSLFIAISEECFFRGALQPLVGIYLNCFIVFLLHFLTTLKLTVYGAYDMIKTLILGLVFQITENIYPLILIHFLLNLVYFAQHFYFFRQIKSTPLKD